MLRSATLGWCTQAKLVTVLCSLYKSSSTKKINAANSMLTKMYKIAALFGQ